jgi:hypothetical protein
MHKKSGRQEGGGKRYGAGRARSDGIRESKRGMAIIENLGGIGRTMRKAIGILCQIEVEAEDNLDTGRCKVTQSISIYMQSRYFLVHMGL